MFKKRKSEKTSRKNSEIMLINKDLIVLIICYATSFVPLSSSLPSCTLGFGLNTA